MAKPIYEIFTNQTINGNSLEFNTNGETLVVAGGTWDGAEIDVYINPYDGVDEWFYIGTKLVEADPSCVLFSNKFAKYRLTLTSAGASTDIKAFVLHGAEADAGDV